MARSPLYVRPHMMGNLGGEDQLRGGKLLPHGSNWELDP